MRNPFKKKKKLMVLIHHIKMKESVEGVWTGMYNGHYQLEAATVILERDQRRTIAGGVLIPKDKVAFLQVLAEDQRTTV